MLALLFVFAPVISLAVFSFQASSVQSLPLTPPTVSWYVNAWDNHEIRTGFLNSVYVGAIVSVVAATLAFMSAHLIARCTPRYSNVYVAVVSLPVFVPLLLSGVALLMYYSRIRLAGNLWAVILAHSCFCSPFAMAIIRGPYERLNVDIENAARNLGAGDCRIILQIVIPQLWPAIAAGILLSFLLSWDEFIVAWFVGGFERTLPVVIYGMMGASFNPSLNAVGTVSIAISGLLLVTVLFLEGLATRRARAT